MPAEWELPPGVTRGLWDYFHDEQHARGYDEQLAGTALLQLDLDFVRRHCTPAGTLIDLGAGTGRASLALAADEYSVMAVDLSPAMLQVLQEKAVLAGVAVKTLEANLVELDALADCSFANAICLFGTLGMIVGRHNRQRFFGQVARILQPGGRFVVHVHNRWYNALTRAGRRLLARELWESWGGRRAAGDYVMPAHQGLGEMTMHLFTRREIVQCLKRAGLQIVEVLPISPDGALRAPWWFGRLRSYGYLLAAKKSTTR